MLQDNLFLEDEIKTEEETQESSSSDEELPDVIIDRPHSKLSSFDGGLLIVWGCGEFGQHGHGHCEDVPIDDALASPLWLGQDRMVLEVACGSSHTLVLTDDNKIYSWGNSNSGQLGVGTTETSPHPRLVHLGVSSGTKLTEITCGTRHSFIWTQDGDCFSFGNNYSAQLGYDFRKPDFKENQLRPVFVDTLLQRSVSQVACGARHSVFLFTNGQVAAVGVNNRGQIGCGDTVDVICPKTVPDLPPISVIACGNSHSIAADVHGSVHVWGYSKACGSKTDVLSPVHVFSSSELKGIQDLAGGDSHSMLLTSDGILYSWGNNFEGQLGLGKSVKFLSDPTKLSPSLLPGMVISVSVGENTSAAVTDDGKLYLWGKNASQIIRVNESSRFFQFEPFHVSLGTWKALKVSCGSWHVACIVCPNQNSSNAVAKISEERPEVETTAVENDSDDSLYDTLLDLRRGEETGIKPKENFTRSDKEIPDSDERGVSDDLLNLLNQTRIESNETVSTVSENTDLESRNTEQTESSYPESSSKDYSGDREVNGVADNMKVIDGADLDNPTVTNDLEEKPASRENEEISDHINKLVHEEKSAISSKEAHLSAPGDPPIKGMSERRIKNLELGFVDRSSLLNHHYLSRTRDIVTKDKDTSTFRDALHEVRPLSSALTEQKTTSSIHNFESNQPDEQTEKNFESSADDEFDYAFEKFKCEPKTVESASEDKKEAVTENKGEIQRVTRPRACSEQHSGDDAPVSQGIASALRSGSLDSLKLHHHQDDTAKDVKSSRVRYSPPAHSQSPVGQLNREKRPARMLRYTSVDMEYHLPNQPVHTVEIGVTPYYRPRPPMNRTQSSPTLYSSNLIGSPLGSRRKNSLSAKIPRPPTSSVNSSENLPPRPPTSSVNSGENLPPRPPARGIRRLIGHKPVFSSGNSWRKRK